MKIVVLDGYALNPGDLSWEPLRALGDLEIFDRTPPELAVERARGATVVLTNKTPLTAGVLDQLPDVRYIGALATGYNVIDIEAARRRGIVVSNVPTYGTASVAQFVFALLLELCHRVAQHAEAVRERRLGAQPRLELLLPAADRTRRQDYGHRRLRTHRPPDRCKSPRRSVCA